MKKRLSISQLTALSFALLPAQQVLTSELPTNQQEASAKPTTQTNNTGWFTALNPLTALLSSSAQPSSSSTKQNRTEAHTQEEITILTLAQEGKLYDKESQAINGQLPQGNLPRLSGILIKLAEEKRKIRTDKLNKMSADMRAIAAEFKKNYKAEAEALEQLLLAIDGTSYANPALLKNSQQECKNHEKIFNELLIHNMVAGFDFANQSKEEREKMDVAIQSAKGTTTLKGSVSPRDRSAAHYAMRVVKNSSIKPENEKASKLETEKPL